LQWEVSETVNKDLVLNFMATGKRDGRQVWARVQRDWIPGAMGVSMEAR
jgi:hypothetical protein